MEREVDIAREDTREEPSRSVGRKKNRRGEGGGGVRLMGSSWIVVPFFFVPVPARSLAPLPGSARRDVLGENSRGLPRRQHPMNDRRKTQAIWVSPLLITNRLVSHKLARWDRCAPRTPFLLRFHISEPFAAAHKYETRGQLVFASEIEYGQVDERRSHVRGGEGGPPEESIPLRCGFLLSRRVDSLLENSCRRMDCGFQGLRFPPSEPRSRTDRKNSLRSARVHQPGLSFNASPLLRFFLRQH